MSHIKRIISTWLFSNGSKTTVVLALCLIGSYNAFGQDYVPYYRQMNTARLMALNGDYHGAAQQYQETFGTYNFEFARDCIHAVEVSCIMKDTQLTAHFMISALKYGVPLSYFANVPKLSWFRTLPEWETLSTMAKVFHQNYLHGVNTDIRAEINEMFRQDQLMRKRFYKGRNVLFRPILGRRWKKLNAVQIARIIAITKEHGFPGERLIGIDRSADHEKIGDHQFSAGMPIILFIHHYSSPNPSFDSILFQQIATGYLYNEHFASICDYEAKFGKGKYSNMGYYGLRFQPKAVAIDTYDAKRKEIGLMDQKMIKALNQLQVLTKYWNWLK